MNLQDAYNYTRPFVFAGIKITPSEDTLYFILMIHHIPYLGIKENNKPIVIKQFSKHKENMINKYSIADFQSLYGNRNFYHPENFDEVFEIKSNFIFTSKGFIDIETFYLAQDIYNSFNFIKKRDIKEGYKYLDILGRELIYIKDRHSVYDDQLFNFKIKYLYHRSSIKLTEELGEVDMDKVDYYIG